MLEAARLGLRYLISRGKRSVFTTLAVTIGVTLVFGLNSIAPTLENAFIKTMSQTAGNIDVSVTGSFGQDFSASVADEVSQTAGIAAVSPEVQKTSPIPSNGPTDPDRPSSATVIGVQQGSPVRSWPLAEGRALAPSDQRAVVMNSDVAQKLGLGVGDTLTLPAAVGSIPLTVVGLLNQNSGPGETQVFIPLSTAQSMFGLGGRLTTVNAEFTKDADKSAVQAALQAKLGDDYTVGGLASDSSLLASMQVAEMAYMMFGLFAMATAAFIILNSFRTVVAERRHDIGMLRAVGMKRRQVLAMFLVESALQGAAGSLVGLVLGALMAYGVFALLGPMVESFMHMSLGNPVFEPSTALISLLIGVGVTIVSALWPARQAAKISPMEALRPQDNAVFRKTSTRQAWAGLGVAVFSIFCLFTGDTNLIGLGAVLILVAVALVLPVLVDPLSKLFGRLIDVIFKNEGAIARSNITRNPSRSATTASAVTLSLAAIVAMVSVITSILAGFTKYLDDSMSADYMFIPQSIVLAEGNVAAGPQMAQRVADTEGIRAVSTIRLAMAREGSSQVQVLGIDPATYLDVAEIVWNTGSSDQAISQLAAGRWVIANGIYATQHSLRPGMGVELDTPSGRKTYFVAGIGNDYLNSKISTLYTSQANLARDFDVDEDIMVFADRTAGSDAAQVEARLQKIADDYPAFKLYDAATLREENIATFNMASAMFDVLIFALAIPSLLALSITLTISVLGRRREIGMMRAIGATRKQVRKMVVAESLLLALIGTAFGSVTGLWLGYALDRATSAVGWEVPYVFPWDGLLVTIVAGVVFAVLAARGPSKSAAGLVVVEALRAE
ncbi:MAG: ABC transporter permease [Propionibacteriaceae bacterium]|jgi:putative ABC transport system permease protein|nr:ABC transporter permease [Propionibacteriaceae bacterium]